MNGFRVHSITHVSYEPLGTTSEWLRERGCSHRATAHYAGERLPELDDFDLLVVMGGPMSANDDSSTPWMREEKALIAEAIGRGKSLLGICLGAQLIASVLEARVYANRFKEIGWFPIELDRSLFPGAAPRQVVFHWHGETFDLPAGARRIASGEACANQGFLYGGRVVGLQFHLEMSPAIVEGLIAHAGAELVPARYVQSAEEIGAGSAHAAANRALLFALLDRFLAPGPLL